MIEGEYEYSSPITVYGTKSADLGGSQGSNQGVIVRSAFGQEACEYAVQLINFEAAGTLAISGDGQPPAVGITNDGGVRGMLVKAVGAAAIPLHPVFTPLVNGIVYLSFSVTGGNVSVTLLFRRSRAAHIPQFAPMLHAANPDNEFAVNAARAEAITRASESSTPRTR